jgi:hypothetical protein
MTAVAHLATVRSPDAAQDVAQRVAGLGPRAVRAVLQVGLDLIERVGVDEVAQLLLAEQLAQQVAVERQRRGAPLGVGRVALVHVRRDVVEQQRGGERRRGLGLDLDERELARVQRAQEVLQAGEVEHVAQALAVGLEDHREVAVALGDLEQRLRLQALLPQRRALARIGARDEQRPRRVLAEARAEQRAAAQLADDHVLELVGVDEDELAPGGSSASGRWTMIPSSDQTASDSRPNSSRIRALSASAQAEWMRPPYGDRMHSRQSPISSRKRSMTIVRSLGTTRVASCCSRR